MMHANWRPTLAAIAALTLAIGITNCVGNDADEPTGPHAGSMDADRANSHHKGGEARTLYVWTSDEDGTAPDLLAVIDFDRKSSTYGKVLSTATSPTTATPRSTATCSPAAGS